jgi:hypothetical protein
MRRDDQLIPPNAPNEEPLHQGGGIFVGEVVVSFAVIVAISRCSVANDAPYAAGSARTTTSNTAPLESTFGNSSHRTKVRSRRFTRFRSTEL